MKIKSIEKYKFRSKKNLHIGGFFTNPTKIKEKIGSEEFVWYDEDTEKCQLKEDLCFGRKGSGDKIPNARGQIEYTEDPPEDSSNRFFPIIIDKYSLLKKKINISVNEEESIQLKKNFFGNILSELNESTEDGEYDIYYVFLNKKSKTGGDRWELRKIKDVQIERITKGTKLNGFKITQNDNRLILEIEEDGKINMEWNISKYQVKGVIKIGTFWLNNKSISGSGKHTYKRKKNNSRYKKRKYNTKKKNI